MSKNNKDNFKDYTQKMGRINLPTPSKDNKTESDFIVEALKEGNLILEEEEKKSKKEANTISVKDDSKKLDDTLGLKSPNPYVKARAQWMTNPKNYWKIKHINQTENKEIPPDQFYEEFIQEVIILGDKLSDSKA